MKVLRLFAGICSLSVIVYASKKGPSSGGYGGPLGGTGPYSQGVLPQGSLGALDSVTSSLGSIPTGGSYGGPPPAPYGDEPPPPYGEEAPPAPYGGAPPAPYGGAPPVPYGGRPARPYHAPAPQPLPFLTKIKIVNLPKMPKFKLPDMPDLSMLSMLIKPKKEKKKQKKKVPVVPPKYSPPAMYGYIQPPPVELRPLPDIAIYLPTQQHYSAPPSYAYSAPPPSYGHSAPPAPHPVAEPRPFSPSY